MRVVYKASKEIFEVKERKKRRPVNQNHREQKLLQDKRKGVIKTTEGGRPINGSDR